MPTVEPHRCDRLIVSRNSSFKERGSIRDLLLAVEDRITESAPHDQAPPSECP
jgi:hypothetical protein